jgi:two-component SAPR family response regulator
MILIVDDDFDITSLIKISLEKADLFVSSFADPLVALKEFRSHSTDYDLVVSDIQMPAMNGYEFAQQVKRIKSNVKIILMNAFGFEYCDRSFAGPLQNSDIDAFIEKPIPLIKLRTIVLTILNNKTLRYKPNVPLP